MRLASGRLQFGTDWPGLFLRGDDAITLGSSIDRVTAWITDCEHERVPAELSLALQRLAEVRALIADVVVTKTPQKARTRTTTRERKER